MLLVGQYDSPFVRRVAVSLRLQGISYEHCTLSVFADAQAMRRINPLGRIPSLRLDDGETLIDSAAILDWLDETVGPERALLPAQGAARRRGLRQMALATGIVDKVGQATYERLLRPAERQWPEWIERCRLQGMSALDALEADTERGLAVRQQDHAAGHHRHLHDDLYRARPIRACSRAAAGRSCERSPTAARPCPSSSPPAPRNTCCLLRPEPLARVRLRPGRSPAPQLRWTLRPRSDRCPISAPWHELAARLVDVATGRNSRRPRDPRRPLGERPFGRDHPGAPTSRSPAGASPICGPDARHAIGEDDKNRRGGGPLPRAGLVRRPHACRERHGDGDRVRPRGAAARHDLDVRRPARDRERAGPPRCSPDARRGGGAPRRQRLRPDALLRAERPGPRACGRAHWVPPRWPRPWAGPA